MAASPIPHSLLTRQSSMLMEEDIERSVSPTTIQTRLRHMSKGYVGGIDLKPTLFSEDDDEGVWSRIINSKHILRLRCYLRKRARNDYILCCLPKKNPSRKRIKTLVNSRYFNAVIGLLVIAHCVVLATYRSYTARDFKPYNHNILYVTIVFEVLYIIEAFLRIIASGLIMHPSSYLRKFPNLVDVIVIIVSFIYLCDGLSNNTLIEVISALISLRLIRIMLPFKTVRFLFKALASSLFPLLYVAWVTFCIMVFFGLVGLEIFRGSLHKACYVEYNDTNTLLPKQFQISQFPCRSPHLQGGHVCSLASDACREAGEGVVCSEWDKGPHSGLVGFDNIGSGLLTVFQCMTLEGWTSVLYLYESVYGPGFVWIYFISLISFGSIFMLNLLLGVLTSVFIGVSDHQEVEGHLRILKKRRKIKEEYEGYQQWMKRGGYRHHGGGANDSTSVIDADDSDSEINEDFDNDYELNNKSNWEPLLLLNKKLRSIIRHVVKSHVFFWLMILAVSINFIILCADFYPAPEKWLLALWIINYMFTALYIIEFLLKLYGLGPRQYFSSQFNRFDFFFTVINIIDILVLVHIDAIYFSVSAIVNSCRAIRLISAFKYTRYWKGMRAIISTFSGVWVVILSVMALLGSFIFAASLIGMRMFGTRLFDVTNLHPTFNDFIDSFLLVFQLTTTEDWNTIMYRSASDERYTRTIPLIVIYYLIIITVGAFIIVNIFLAIAIDKLSEVKAVNEDSSHRLEQREEERREIDEQLNALKDPLHYFKLSQTLRKVLIFYSTNLKEEEQLQESRRRKRGRDRSVSETHVRMGRSVSLPSSEAKRRSFAANHAASDPGNMLEDEDEKGKDHFKHYLQGLVPQKVSIVNPLTKFFKSGTSSTSLRTAGDPYEATPTTRTNQSNAMKAVKSHDLSQVLRKEDNRRIADTSFTREDSLESISLQLVPPTPSLSPPTDYQATPTSTPSFARAPPTDASVARLVRKSSLEDIDLIALPESERVGGARGGATSNQGSRERFKKARNTWNIFKKKGLLVLKWLSNYFGSIIIDPREELKEIPAHSSFFILAPDNRLRVYCYNVVKSKPFQTITFTIIILSCILLTMELPVASTNRIICGIQGTIIFFDIFCSVWFLVEFILKFVSLGAFIHKGSYFHCLFNIIDFFVVVTTLIPIVLHLNVNLHLDEMCLSYSQRLYDQNNNFISVVLVFRVLRPLRLWRVEGLFLVTKGLGASLRRMGYVFFVGTVLLLIFAVIGVQLFKGRFFYCSDLVTQTEEDCRGQYFIYPSNDLNCPRVLNRTWRKWDLHFDNIGWSFLSIYTMITKEGWQDIMYHAIDSYDVAAGPQYNASREALIYYVVFMGVVTFFLINLLVGFVIVTFQQVGIKRYKEANLDRNQRNCLYFSLTSAPRKRYIPRFSLHEKLFNFVKSWPLRLIINIAVAINVILLASQYNDMGHDYIVIVYWINVGFTALFALEAVFKIIILTPAHYFRSSERGLEVFFVIGSILELVLQSILVKDPYSMWRYSHIASSLRVLRLVQISRNTRLIVWTVLRSLEIFPWVGVLLIAILYTYAVVGMQVFGRIKPGTIDDSITNAIHQFNNFENFPQALLVMIRCFTGENWERIMLGSVNASCVNDEAGSCGSSFTYFFYPSFLLISSILVLNLFVAIIIDNFDYFIRDKAILGSHDMTKFFPLWAKYDPTASGKIHHSDLIKLMRSVSPPLGWGRLCSQVSCYRRMITLHIPVDDDGLITFNATLFAIVRVTLKIDIPYNNDNNNNGCNTGLRSKLQSVFPNCPKKMLDTVLPERPVHTTSEEYAALFIQQFWRRWKLQVERQCETRPHHQRMSNVLRRIPDMGPGLLQRRLTTITNMGIDQLALSPSNVMMATNRSLSPSGSKRYGEMGVAPVLQPLRSLDIVKLESIDETNDQKSDEDQESSPVGQVSDLGSGPTEPESVQESVSTKFNRSQSIDSDIFYDPVTERSPSLAAKRQSMMSDSDGLFATPTGSVTSADSTDTITETTV